MKLKKYINIYLNKIPLKNVYNNVNKLKIIYFNNI